MKKIILPLCFIFVTAIIGCSGILQGSNVSSGIVHTINHDTLTFFGNRNKYVCMTDHHTSSPIVEEHIRFTFIKLSTDTSLTIIKRIL